MRPARKICVFSGTRAEYGLLRPLLEEVRSDSSLQLQLVVSGMHLSPEFGLTYKEIEEDGFKIDERVEMLVSSDSAVGTCKSLGLGLIGYGESLARLKPDVAVVLGDRFETLGFATAALLSGVPLAHIAGGEATFGAYDESMRHAVTKMSHLHFTSTDVYRRRVIQLGENPEHVHNVGSTGLDNIKRLKPLSRAELERDLGMKFGKRNLLVTFHPETLAADSADQMRQLLASLAKLDDCFIIFTKANADAGGRKLNEMVESFVEEHPQRAAAFASLGHTRYLSLLTHVDAVIGNSSSGIIEAPSLKVGTVNIGDRQAGRVQAGSIVNCEAKEKSIDDAIKTVLSAPFREKLKTVVNPYGDGQATSKIKAVLKDVALERLKKKTFFDIKTGAN